MCLILNRKTIYGLNRREGRGKERRQQQVVGAEAEEEGPTGISPMRNISEEKHKAIKGDYKM